MANSEHELAEQELLAEHIVIRPAFASPTASKGFEPIEKH